MVSKIPVYLLLISALAIGLLVHLASARTAKIVFLFSSMFGLSFLPRTATDQTKA